MMLSPPATLFRACKILAKSDEISRQGRPSLCRNCGAIVAAGEKVCPQCGINLATSAAASAAAAQQPARGADQASAYERVQDSDAMRFARAVLTRPAPFTIAFLVANVFLSLMTAMSGGTENNQTLLAYGGQTNGLLNAGEWWRLVTPIFLHAGIIHLLMNMYGLWILGQYVERLYGSAKFVFFWIASGIAGSVATYLTMRPDAPGGFLGQFLFRTQDGVSIGASGALFGIIGVLLVFGIKYRRELPEGFRQAFGAGLLPMILMNVFIGYIGRGFINNAAHMGGLVAGALLALIIGYKRPDERGSVVDLFWRAAQVAAIALVLFSFFKVWQSYAGVPPSLKSLTSPSSPSSTEQYLTALNEGEATFVNAFNNNDLKGVEEARGKLERAPELDKTSAALRDELKDLLARLGRFITNNPDVKKPLPRSALDERKGLGEAFDAWQKKEQDWIVTDGKRYGIELTKP